MKKVKIILILLFFQLFMFFVNSYVIIDGNNYYFINKINPKINISIFALGGNVNINEATLFLVNESGEFQIQNFTIDYFQSNNFKTYLNFGDNETYIFNLDLSNYNLNNTFKFLLNATNEDGEIVNTYSGDKLKFFLKFDNKKPELKNKENGTIVRLNTNLNIINFEANENLKGYVIELYDTNGLVESYSDSKNYEENQILSEYRKDFSLNIQNLDKNKNYKLVVKITDLAGNIKEYTFYLISNNFLNVEIISNKEDPNKNYFFDDTLPNFKNFFNGSLYSRDNYINLTLRTSIPSKCYYSENLINFTNYTEILSHPSSYNNFTSKESFEHYIKIDFSGSKKFEVFCISDLLFGNLNLGEETVYYLNEKFGFPKKLLKIKKYEGDFSILDYSPISTVTKNPFLVYMKTSKKAVCEYNYSYNSQNGFLDNSNFIEHNKSLNTQSGNYNLKLDCINRVGEHKIENLYLNVDLQKLVNIVSYKPKYTGKANVKINVTFSETPTECRYSNSEIQTSNYYSIPNSNKLSTTENPIILNFDYTLSKNNENQIFIYCLKENLVSENTIVINYDKYGPQFKEIYFETDALDKTNYTNMKKNFKVVYNFETNFSGNIDYYNITIYNNSGVFENKIVKTNKYKINDDIIENGFVKFEVFAVNKRSNKKSITASINFKTDFNKPIVNAFNQNGYLKIECTDDISGCGSIFYGFYYNEGDNCLAINKYKDNENIKIKKNDNYVCVKAFDKAGNLESINKLINSNFADASDQDNDGIPDYWEDLYGLNKTNPNDAELDNDNDGLNNLLEFYFGTNPNKKDTDNDGCNDKFEYDNGYIGNFSGDCNTSSNSNSSLENATNTNNSIIEPVTNKDNQNESSLPPPQTDEGFNYGILVAIFIFLVVTGSGSYYAYKKGYLNDYLNKLGIKTNNLNKNNSNNSLANQNLKNSNNIPKGKVQSHIDKINKYIEKRNKDLEKILGGFEPKKVKKIKKSENKEEDDDEFYESSLKINPNSFDINKEAEQFEDYYKNKSKKKKKKKK